MLRIAVLALTILAQPYWKVPVIRRISVWIGNRFRSCKRKPKK